MRWRNKSLVLFASNTQAQCLNLLLINSAFGVWLSLFVQKYERRSQGCMKSCNEYVQITRSEPNFFSCDIKIVLGIKIGRKYRLRLYEWEILTETKTSCHYVLLYFLRVRSKSWTISRVIGQRKNSQNSFDSFAPHKRFSFSFFVLIICYIEVINTCEYLYLITGCLKLQTDIRIYLSGEYAKVTGGHTTVSH